MKIPFFPKFRSSKPDPSAQSKDNQAESTNPAKDHPCVHPETQEKLVKKIEEFEKSWFSIFIRRRKLTYLVIIFLLLLGIVQINTLPRELNPEVKIPYGIVTTVYPGASSADVEQQVTKEIESKVSSLDGIKRLESRSSFGVSSISIEFEADQDLEDSIRKLKDKVDEAKPDLPEDANDPQVMEVNLDDMAILAFSLQGSNYDLSDLKKMGEDLEDELKSITGISRVEVIGGSKKELKVKVKPDKLSELGYSTADVINAIRAQNVNFPLGSIEVGELTYGVRVENEVEDAATIGNFILGQKDGADIRVKDVADVYEDFEDSDSYARISVNGQPTEETVTLALYKKTGGNINEIAAAAKQKVEESRGRVYPDDVEVAITTDMARYIQKSINDLMQNGIGTVIIVLVLLIIFMGVREAFITSMAVPFSFFIAFVVMASLGQSLNYITLFSLVLALGLLVDSAVVIVEGMYEKISKYCMTGYAAAMLSVKEYAVPLLSGMLTTVAAFFPLLFVKGIFGEFLKGIPIVVISTLVAALFVALTIVPTIGATVLKPKKIKEGEDQPRQNLLSRLLYRLAGYYKKTIVGIIGVRKNRVIIMVGSWALFFASLYFPISGYLKLEAFGNPDTESFWISLKMPEGTVKEKTNATVERMEAELYDLPEVENFVTSVGSSSSNRANITINLTKKEERELTSPQIAQMAKEKLKNITEGKIEIEEESGGPPSGEPLEARVSGPELDELERIAEDLKHLMEETPGAESVDTNVDYDPGEFLVTFNPEILAAYQLSVAGVSSQLRQGVSGNNDLKIIREGDEIKINVGYPDDTVTNINDLRNLVIPTPAGDKVALGTLADIQIQGSISSINRRDEERSITISGKNQEGQNINEIMAAYKQKVANYNLPAGYSVDYGGQSQEQNEVYMDMFVKMIIGIILILFILVAQFNSYRQTLVILFTIPLAMIGVIWGMTIAGMTLDIPAFIGIVSLCGIVVNNAIILIDYINRLRRDKPELSLVEAAATGGKARLRPIILTTATTVLGLLPLSIREPDWRNMGFSIIFGLAFSTLLTLFVVPSVYVSLETGRKKKSAA